MVDRAYLLLRVSPWQCLTSPVMIGAPSPSHPTVRSVFPSTAVRQSSSHIMRRFHPVREHAAADVGEPHRIQLAIRKAFPSETPAFPALGQVPAKTKLPKKLMAIASPVRKALRTQFHT